MEKKVSNFFLFSDNEKISLFFKEKEGKDYLLKTAVSLDGHFFKLTNKKPYFKRGAKKENIEKFVDFKVSKLNKKYFITFKKIGFISQIFGTTSTNLTKWDLEGPVTGIKNTGSIISDYLYDDDRVMYVNTPEGLKTAYSKNLKKWVVEKDVVLKPRKSKFDSGKITLSNVFLKDEGIAVFYYCEDKNGKFAVGLAFFDKDNPKKLLWRSDKPIWTPKQKGQVVNPIGVGEINDNIIFYFQNSKGELASIKLPVKLTKKKRERKAEAVLKKVPENPIFGPIDGRAWESFAAFNPTAFEHNGKIYLLYRAMGWDALSTVGCAISENGINITERYDNPIYVPRKEFEGATICEDKNGLTKSMSGGGWGGCEDARATIIDDRLYLLYVAFNGQQEMDIAVSSISLKDFDKKDWKKWTDPKLITCRDIKTKSKKSTVELIEDRPSVVQTGTGEKDAAVLPEKINGKYVVFHRTWPNIVFDYVDNLNFDGKTFLKGEYIIPVRKHMWDSHKIGLGATPVRIKEGWLLIYNAVDLKDFSKYKIGAMILDAKNLEKILYRSVDPILEPETNYENNGNKHGIVFATGAIIKDGTLFVYYGGSDKYACVATASLDEFVKDMVEAENPKLQKVEILGEEK